jgi:cystathionine beta-lyase family protein involved in aluminum resistance
MRLVSFTDALQEATTLCVVCLRQGGETDHEAIKSKTLAVVRAVFASDRPAVVNVVEVDGDGKAEMESVHWGGIDNGFRLVLLQRDRGERCRPDFQEQVIAQVAWLVDQLWDHPNIVAASDSGRPVVIGGG